MILTNELYQINLLRLATLVELFIPVDAVGLNGELAFISRPVLILFELCTNVFGSLLFGVEISKNSKNPANLAATQSCLRL